MEVTTDVKANYAYYENGLKKSVSYPTNGVAESYTYYPNGQLKELSNTKSGAVLYKYTYEYDAAGNQTRKVETKAGASGLVTNYGYDRLNHLLKVTETDATTEYTYDQAGNRTTEAKITNGETKLVTYTYNEQNRLISTKEDIGTTKESVNYIYDNNGNLLYSKKEQLALITDPQNIPDASFSMFIMGQTTPEENPFVAWMSSYSYDSFNQMVKSTTAEGVIENKYNGEGLRTEKTLDGALTRYLYIEDQPVLEVDQYGRELAQNIMGTNLVSRIVDDSAEMYYLYNGHADVTELITPQGEITAEYTYDAFGVPKKTTGTADNPFRYAGYQYDESGLYYLNSRMYNPVIARFMQEDTYRGELNDPLSLNLYAYCNNNPLIYSDPTGHGLLDKIKKVFGIKDKKKDKEKPSGTINWNNVNQSAASYTSTAGNFNTAGANSYGQKNNSAVTPPPSTPAPTINTKKETNVVATSQGTPVKVTLPPSLGGGEVTGYISGGKTTIPGYGKLPEGTTVHTQGGAYTVVNGAGVKDTPAKTSSTSGGNNYDNLISLTNKLSIVNDCMDAQKNPKAAQLGAKAAINQLSFAFGGTVTDTGQALAGYTFAGNKLSTAERGMYVVGAAIPFVNGAEIKVTTKVTGEIFEGAGEAGKGFETFKDLKTAVGSPGENNQWHHIVEQSQINKSGFSPTQIQNTDNIIAVDKTIHGQISGYYSSKQAFTGGNTVRNWLTGQSYDAQFEFGMQKLKDLGVIK